jgi:hypothetical protein
MNGIHRGAAGNPVIAALKVARWPVTILAIVAVPVALLALGIYLIFFGTDLELWGVNCLIAMAVLIQAVVRRSRGPAYLRWLTPAWLLAAAWNVFSAFAHQRRWPPGQLHSVDLAGYGVGAVIVTLLCIALVIGIRSGGFRRRRQPASQVTPSD